MPVQHQYKTLEKTKRGTPNDIVEMIRKHEIDPRSVVDWMKEVGEKAKENYPGSKRRYRSKKTEYTAARE